MTKNHNFLKFPRNSIETLGCTGVQEKEIIIYKNRILKTMVQESVYLLGQSSHVSVMANFTGTHTPMRVLKNGEREDNETFRQHLWINFQH